MGRVQGALLQGVQGPADGARRGGQVRGHGGVQQVGVVCEEDEARASEKDVLMVTPTQLMQFISQLRNNNE